MECIYELTEVMRQKNEVEFINALNNLANDNMKVEDVNLIKSRCVIDEEVADNIVRLYASNNLVDAYNMKRIKSFEGEEFLSLADDCIVSDMSRSEKDKILTSLRSKSTSECSGLPCQVLFKVGIKYMITSNIDIEDGLVNGACGVLKHITFENNSVDISIVWIEFNIETVGRKARSKYKAYMLEHGLQENLTPILKQKITLNVSHVYNCQIIRKQFSVVAAEAVTIHKSQGQTYDRVCLDLRRCKKMTKPMLYVALSRTNQFEGLYLIGDFIPPRQETKDSVNIEIDRLRNQRKLNLSFNNLFETEGKTIIFLNIRSLNKHGDKIVHDEWYRRGDILIFAETRLKNNDAI